MEMMVAVAIGMLVMAGATTFFIFAARSISSTTAQTVASQQASQALQFIHNRIQLATLVSNDATGNILTLGFDTNYTVDSGRGGGGVAWANQDYYERFEFVGTNTTNVAACRTNQLIYYTNINSTNCRVLIPAGVRNLPFHNVFFVTNSVLVSVCFGVVDTSALDTYQGIDIQTMSASLNRPKANNMVTILPLP